MLNVNNEETLSFDPNQYASLFLDVNTRIQKIHQICLQHEWHISAAKQWNDLLIICQEMIQKITIDPKRIIEASLSCSQEYLSLFQSTWSNTAEDVAHFEKNDKRFKDAVWHEHPVFKYLQKNYLIANEYIQNMLSHIETHDKNAAKKLRFYMRQLLDAISPSNFIFSNPSILYTTIKDGGKNILNGLDNFIADLERNGGKLQIKMTDLEAFEIGKNIAVTPGKVIYQNDMMQLIQYKAQTKRVYLRPLLIIPPWINKYYILDLSRDNSFIDWIVRQGYTVFLISWVNPDQSHAHKNFEDYLLV